MSTQKKLSKDLRDRGFIVANVDTSYVSERSLCRPAVRLLIRRLFYLERSRPNSFSKSGYHFAGISAGSHLALMFGYTTEKGNTNQFQCLSPTSWMMPVHLLSYEKI